MSRVTASIHRIHQELDKISGLDGVVANKVEGLEKQVKDLVNEVLNEYPNANLFNYSGDNMGGHD